MAYEFQPTVDVTLRLKDGGQIIISQEEVTFDIQTVKQRHVRLAANILNLMRDIEKLVGQYNNSEFKEDKDANT